MIIYTVNTNQYDIMSDKHYFHKNVKYVCFYSGEINKVGKWEYIKINGIKIVLFNLDNIKSTILNFFLMKKQFT